MWGTQGGYRCPAPRHPLDIRSHCNKSKKKEKQGKSLYKHLHWLVENDDNVIMQSGVSGACTFNISFSFQACSFNKERKNVSQNVIWFSNWQAQIQMLTEMLFIQIYVMHRQKWTLYFMKIKSLYSTEIRLLFFFSTKIRLENFSHSNHDNEVNKVFLQIRGFLIWFKRNKVRWTGQWFTN